MRTPSTTLRLAGAGLALVLTLLAAGPARAQRAATGVDWSTFGFDLQRTGQNPSETTIGVGNAGQLHLLWSFHVNATTVSQAMVADGVLIRGTPTQVVYVGAESGYVFAVRASTGQQIWKRFVGIEETTDNCGGPYGVDGSVTIDRSTNRLYVPGGDDKAYALDLSTGAIASGWPVTVSANVLHEHLWSGLTLNQGRLYVPVASYCDQPPYRGRVTVIDAATATVLGSWFVTGRHGPYGGGVWGTGGVSIDPANNDVYAATGNALAFPENPPYADAVVRLTPNLRVRDWNSPNLVAGDIDFGTTPTLYQAPGCPAQLVAPNKSGVLFLYGRDSIGAGPGQSVTVSQLDGTLQTVAAYSPAQNMVYVASGSSFGTYTHGLLAFSVQSDCTLQLAWQQTAGVDATAPEGSPTVANGVVYFGDGYGNQYHAYDASNGTPLWDSGSDVSGPAWSAPTVVNGMLYFGAADGFLRAYGP